MRNTAILIGLAMAVCCNAADYVWTGGGHDGCWTTPANWNPGTGFPHSGDSVTFPESSSNVTVNLGGDQSARAIVFNPVQHVSYKLTGGSLTLDDGGSILYRQLGKEAGLHAQARQIIESAIRLKGSATFGSENRWYFGNELLVLAGGISGSGPITVNSERGGCVGFAGDNSGFTGALTIGNGLVYITHRAGLGSGTTPVTMNGGQFWVSAVPTVRDFMIASNASWSATISPAGPHAGTIRVAKGATWTYGTGGNSSSITGTAAGEGTLVWSGGHGTTIGGTAPNTLTGSYTIGGGHIALAKPAGVDAVAGPLILQAGACLRWDADEQVADAAPLTIAGDLAVMDLNGHRETLGALELKGHGFLDCGAGSNGLRLADSRAVAWNLEKELVVRKWKGKPAGGGADQLAFAGGAAGLTAEQLACVGFRDPEGLPEGVYSAKILASGEIVPGNPVVAVNPPYDLSEKAMSERRKLYEVPGRAKLSSAETPLKAGMKIAFFGDSITWGGGYIGCIQKALDTGEGTKGLGVKLINHGVNGGGVLTLRDGDTGNAHVGGTQPRPFAQNLADDKPDVAVVYIGINDIWWRNTNPADFVKALGDLVRTAKAAKVRPVLATLSVWGDCPTDKNARNAKADEYAELTRKVAAETGATLVDLRKSCMAFLRNENRELRLNGSLRFADTGILTGDGVHANGRGNELLADLICQGIFEALR